VGVKKIKKNFEEFNNNIKMSTSSTQWLFLTKNLSLRWLSYSLLEMSESGFGYFGESDSECGRSHFSDSAPVSKFFNPVPGLGTFKVWESDSCSDSGYRRGNRYVPRLLFREWLRRILLLPNLKRDSGCGPKMSQIFYSVSGSEKNA